MRLNLGKAVIVAKWLMTDQPTSAAIDVTHRCNLHCAHCYWWKQEQATELGDREMIHFMKRLRSMGLRAAILYGGEPTLRLGLCRAASRIFDATLVFTNGTNGFPELDRGQWVLSLDGPEEVNDSIRGKGVYLSAVKNVLEATVPPIVHMTISRLNQDRVEDFVKEMLALPVKGIGFSFFTPDRGTNDSGLFIPLTERDRIVLNLLSLRRRYGKKIGFTPAMARQLLTTGAYSAWNRFSDCPVSGRVRCFASDGRRKRCTYGDEADCSRCGCAAVVAYRGAFKPFDLETLKVILGLMIPDLKRRPLRFRGRA
jgi:MoaA/NifB/PqqE/SkfB family radical SAM enzyme